MPETPHRKAIENARQLLTGRLHRTPILSSQSLNRLSGAQLFFKAENFQKTGSFKARGALNSVLNLSPREQSAGVATHSSGNHGQALAWAAREVGVACWVVMPENAPKAKVAAVREYGGEVIFCAANLPAREEGLRQVQNRTGAHFIPPYDYWPTVYGQATCAAEILEEEPALDALIAPVGGGGLLAGTCLSARAFSSGLAVYGAEPEGADDAFRSLKSGIRVQELEAHTIADGLRTTLGEITFPIILERVADILLCSDQEILAAQRLIWERMKILIEPSCATPLAVVLRYPKVFANKRLGLILTGGNTDLHPYFAQLAQSIDQG